MFVLNSGVGCISFLTPVLLLFKVNSCDPSLSPFFIFFKSQEGRLGTTVTPSPFEVIFKAITLEVIVFIAKLRGSPVPNIESLILPLALCLEDVPHISCDGLRYAFCHSTHLSQHFVSSIFEASIQSCDNSIVSAWVRCTLPLRRIYLTSFKTLLTCSSPQVLSFLGKLVGLHNNSPVVGPS